MVESLEQRIDHVTGHYREWLAAAREISLSTQNKEFEYAFKTVLCMAAIAGLSRLVYPRHAQPADDKRVKKDREAFTEFLCSFCDWPESERVCLPYLIETLRDPSDARFSELQEFAHARVAKWDRATPVDLVADPGMSQVQSLWPKGSNGRLIPIKVEGKRVTPDMLTHANLLYIERNALVHGARWFSPKYNPQATEPYYACEDWKPVGGQRQWILIYPHLFCERLVEAALVRVEEYFLERQVVPPRDFCWGPFMIEALNERWAKWYRL